jgi:long-subunit fatty acid transport protein
MGASLDAGRDDARQGERLMTSRARLATAALAALTLLPSGASWAVTDEEVFRNFRFNFVNPGGRALAMGGAFVGIADDATAAAANPAGLTNLLSAELFTEWRLSAPSTSNLTTRVADPRGIEESVLTESVADPSNVLHPSFVSFVKPFENWVFAISRQEVLHSDVDTRNLFSDAPQYPPTDIVLADGSIETLLEYYNLSFGFRGGEKFAAGVNLSYARLDVESRTDNFFNFGSGLEADYSTVVDDSDDDFAWSVGLLYKPIEKLHVGFVYRDGPEFHLDEDILDTRPPGNYPSALVLADYLGNRNFTFDPSAPFGIGAATFDDPLSFGNRINVPDQYGLGIGYRPTEALTIAVDIVHVEYSDLEDDLVGNVNALTFPGDAPDCDLGKPNPDGTFPCDYTTPLAQYVFDDETIYRLGIEYLWTIKDKVPFALRGGVYVDPNVRLEAKFPEGGVFIADSETFPTGDDQTHYTFGMGLVLQDKFQIDVGADFSNNDDTYILSFIYHF